MFDNAEHVLDPTARLIEDLLSRCAELRVLVTSRSRLVLPSEHVYELAGLSSHDEGPALFRERAGTPETNTDRITAICERLGGLALAIELAAIRSRTLGLDGVEAALGDTGRLLVGGARLASRHRSMDEVLRWSYALLDNDAQLVFRRVSVFVSSFDVAQRAARDSGSLSATAAAVAKCRVASEAAARLEQQAADAYLTDGEPINAALALARAAEMGSRWSGMSADPMPAATIEALLEQARIVADRDPYALTAISVAATHDRRSGRVDDAQASVTAARDYGDPVLLGAGDAHAGLEYARRHRDLPFLRAERDDDAATQWRAAHTAMQAHPGEATTPPAYRRVYDAVLALDRTPGRRTGDARRPGNRLLRPDLRVLAHRTGRRSRGACQRRAH